MTASYHRILLTTHEAAELLGMSARTLEVARWRGSWQLPFYKVGRRRVGYLLEDVKAFALQSKRYNTGGAMK